MLIPTIILPSRCSVKLVGMALGRLWVCSRRFVQKAVKAGYIDLPGEFPDTKPSGKIQIKRKESSSNPQITILEGFPRTVVGELIFCHQDNLNTDGIFPGKYTYNDDFTPAQQAQVVMENYDPEFGKIVKEGDILVGGFNFGTGSSREQAATALKYRGICLVLAGSFSETYKRNAINNGFLVIDAPELVKNLKEKYGTSKLSVRTGIQAKIDFSQSRLEALGETYSIDPVGTAAQELVIAGGLENWVKARLNV